MRLLQGDKGSRFIAARRTSKPDALGLHIAHARIM